jgi:hypothetical protein
VTDAKPETKRVEQWKLDLADDIVRFFASSSSESPKGAVLKRIEQHAPAAPAPPLSELAKAMNLMLVHFVGQDEEDCPACGEKIGKGKGCDTCYVLSAATVALANVMLTIPSILTDKVTGEFNKAYDLPAAPPASPHTFQANHSIPELAAMQGVKPLTDPSVLHGGIPEDEDVDEFLTEIKDRNPQESERCPECGGERDKPRTRVLGGSYIDGPPRSIYACDNEWHTAASVPKCGKCGAEFKDGVCVYCGYTLDQHNQDASAIQRIFDRAASAPEGSTKEYTEYDSSGYPHKVRERAPSAAAEPAGGEKKL